ncbi:DUF7684 family protein [Mucilaginibacter sp. R-33]|uniref:DUF7684 family protein n=1 Tax=Mucilaginibacter sp. R-33 TaxID=3416711 RepID=UPI003CEF763C
MDWTKNIPGEKWVLVADIDKKDKTLLDDIACKAIDHDVCYACCTGSYGEFLHDYIDEIIVLRNVGVVEGHLPIDDIITTWHNDGLADALWFAFYCTDHAGDLLMIDLSERETEPDWHQVKAELIQME